eukprot:scaffold71608_cov63-Phaeocystis_antarctica.AAC.2
MTALRRCRRSAPGCRVLARRRAVQRDSDRPSEARRALRLRSRSQASPRPRHRRAAMQKP